LPRAYGHLWLVTACGSVASLAPTCRPWTPGGEEFPYSVKRPPKTYVRSGANLGARRHPPACTYPYSLGRCAQRDRSARSLVGRRWTYGRELHIRRSAPAAGSLREPQVDFITSRCPNAVVVSILVSVALVLPRSPRNPSRLLRSLQTARTLMNSGGDNLESVLGSHSRGFESRILRCCDKGKRCVMGFGPYGAPHPWPS
jgi:hypothetical protein